MRTESPAYHKTLIQNQKLTMKTILTALLLFCMASVAQSQTSYIQVNGEPGLSVFLNGDFQGKTTAELKGYIIENVTPGENLIKIVKDGYTPFEERISVRAGEVLAYKVKPFTKHLVTISEKGNNEETSKKAAVVTGKLIVQSVPIEIKITIPDIEGVTNAPKTKDEWIVENIPAANYPVSFSFNGKIINKTVPVSANEITNVFVNMLNGEVTIKNSRDEKIELGTNARYLNELATRFKYKNKQSAYAFGSFNAEAGNLMRKKGFNYNNTTSYSTIKGLGNPYPEGVSSIVVDNNRNMVISYQNTFKSGNDAAAVNAAYNSLLKEIKANIPEKFLKYNDYGVVIQIPGFDFIVTLAKWNFNKWTAVAITFSAVD